MQGVIDVTFTAEARRVIDAFLSSIVDYPPTLALMKGRASGDTEDCWRYGAYGPDNIKHVEPPLLELGKPLLYAVDGYIAAVPQFQFIHELEGKSLSVGERGLVVVERTHDV
jgi:hypothetical protein